ncbi:hypothetical protein [Paraburkholderia caribensis]|uniref:hypothetical protein n=1 Tax=Paraburkholderia caribensis TaxID=75105 RepID=UPI001CAE8B2A|nr:hypothetical protein [Paraburkholderia caribensis]CAG9249986.1 hypothetical protein PCAR4_260095 [Paraburkholderia caribensis]
MHPILTHLYLVSDPPAAVLPEDFAINAVVRALLDPRQRRLHAYLRVVSGFSPLECWLHCFKHVLRGSIQAHEKAAEAYENCRAFKQEVEELLTTYSLDHIASEQAKRADELSCYVADHAMDPLLRGVLLKEPVSQDQRPSDGDHAALRRIINQRLDAIQAATRENPLDRQHIRSDGYEGAVAKPAQAVHYLHGAQAEGQHGRSAREYDSNTGTSYF